MWESLQFKCLGSFQRVGMAMAARRADNVDHAGDAGQTVKGKMGPILRDEISGGLRLLHFTPFRDICHYIINYIYL